MRLILLTGEYPPYAGGVADYTYQVAHGLRQRGIGVEVIVFREPPGSIEPAVTFVGSAVNPVSLRRASRIIEKSSEDRILLVQYVPQGYGLKGMNLPFVLWLSRLTETTVWVMFHEVQVTVAQGAPWKHRLLAFITQDMAQRIAKRADHCFVSISSFIDPVKKFTRAGVRVEWLPVPSNLPAEGDQSEVAGLRVSLLEGGTGPLVGNFGTYGRSVQPLVQSVVEQSRRLHPEWKFVFIGRGSQEFLNELEERGVVPPGSAVASGSLGAAEAACWIKACDVMVQPYPDGVSSRRTTLMAALALGKATVSNLGHLSDNFWAHSQSLYITGQPDAGELVAAVAAVLRDTDLRNRLQTDAAGFYSQKFSLDQTLQRLDRVVADRAERLAH
jgi:glycosyltransferase involved in cell wall biosynthesis